MFAYPFRTAALALTAIVGLSACTTPYGYGGVSVGAGNGYYDPYYGGYGYGAGYPAYGYGYGGGYPGYGYGSGYPGYGYAYAPYWGWYDDFYYPGTGYYVYDVYRHPHRWTDAQRRYWTQRRDHAVSTGTTAKPVVVRDNWDDFRRDQTTSRQPRVDRNSDRFERRRKANIEGTQPAQVERTEPVRIERQQVERVRPVRVERTERQQVDRSTNVVRTERQAVREQRRSDARAERANRSEARDRNKNRDE